MGRCIKPFDVWQANGSAPAEDPPVSGAGADLEVLLDLLSVSELRSEVSIKPTAHPGLHEVVCDAFNKVTCSSRFTRRQHEFRSD